MFVPINTDAPLYHFPWATIMLIVVNMACFLLTGCAMNEERLIPWMLEYGNGINPFQWLTSMFAHAGWIHLIGNMFFLWGFGLVVEGKLGFRRFLSLYLAIGLIQGGLVDLLTLHRTDSYILKNVLNVEDREQLRLILAGEAGLDAEDFDELDDAEWNELTDFWIAIHKGRCLGASGAIFGILAVSLVWAPKNDMHVVGTILFRPVSFEVSILVYASFYLALNFLGVLLTKGEMGTSSLHILGAVVGFAAGVLYLRKGWVDCENWDLFAVLSGRYGRFASEDWALGAHSRTGKVYSEIPLPQDSVAATADLMPINGMIDDGDYMGASEAMLELRLTDSRSQLDADRLKKLGQGLLQAGAVDEAEIFLEEYIERFPEDSVWAILRKAHLLLQNRRRPSAASALLRTLKASQLTEKQLPQARKLLAAAKKQIREGVLDAESEW